MYFQKIILLQIIKKHIVYHLRMEVLYIFIKSIDGRIILG